MLAKRKHTDAAAITAHQFGNARRPNQKLESYIFPLETRKNGGLQTDGIMIRMSD